MFVLPPTAPTKPNYGARFWISSGGSRIHRKIITYLCKLLNTGNILGIGIAKYC